MIFQFTITMDIRLFLVGFYQPADRQCTTTGWGRTVLMEDYYIETLILETSLKTNLKTINLENK